MLKQKISVILIFLITFLFCLQKACIASSIVYGDFTPVTGSGNLYILDDAGHMTLSGDKNYVLSTFSEFSLTAGDIASFRLLSPAKCIIVRGNGDNAFSIQGTVESLKSDGSKGNIIFVNSIGIFYGGATFITASAPIIATSYSLDTQSGTGIDIESISEPVFSATNFVDLFPDPSPISTGDIDKIVNLTGIVSNPADQAVQSDSTLSFTENTESNDIIADSSSFTETNNSTTKQKADNKNEKIPGNVPVNNIQGTDLSKFQNFYGKEFVDSINLNNSKKNEFVADTNAITSTIKTGYHPAGLIGFLISIKLLEDDSKHFSPHKDSLKMSSIFEYRHPKTVDRIKRVKKDVYKLLDNNHRHIGMLNQEKYNQVMSSIKTVR